MSAYLQGITLEDIQRERDEILSAQDSDIRALKGLVESVLAEKNLCVIGNEETLRENSKMFGKLENLYQGMEQA